MSPRSEEFMREARQRLAALDELAPDAHPSAVVSLAYYAMLYAARAALSEHERYARTHRGTWQLVREVLVEPGHLDPALAVGGQKTQELREGGDYRAVEVAPADAEAAVDLARRFVAAVEALDAQR